MGKIGEYTLNTWGDASTYTTLLPVVKLIREYAFKILIAQIVCSFSNTKYTKWSLIHSSVPEQGEPPLKKHRAQR